jgi:hypothetical protein
MNAMNAAIDTATPSNDNAILAVVNATTYRQQIGAIMCTMDSVRGSGIRSERDRHLDSLRRAVLALNCMRIARTNAPLEREAVTMLGLAAELLARHAGS